MALSLQDAWYNSLGSVGYTGALEDRLYAWLNGINSITSASGAAYTITKTDFIIHSTRSTTGAQTITLGTDLLTTGRIIVIKDAADNAGTNNITIVTEGSEKIDVNLDSVAIIVDSGVLRVYTDGIGWFVV